MNCATVKIKATDPEQGEFIVINEDDFDAEKHELHVESIAEPEEPAAEAEKPAKKK